MFKNKNIGDVLFQNGAFQLGSLQFDLISEGGRKAKITRRKINDQSPTDEDFRKLI